MPRTTPPHTSTAPSGPDGPVRDLLVVAQTPVLGTGQALRIYTLARALAANDGALTMVYVRFGAPEPDEAFRAIPGIELHEVQASRGLRRALAYGRRRLLRAPAAWARGISPELVATASEQAAAPSVRRVIADGPVVASALAGLARVRPVIYNAHNLESAFRHELDPAGLGSPRAFRAAERRLLERATESWMVSEADLAGARELCPTAALRYVPNVIDTAAVKPLREPSREPRILMVADFTYEPNRDGLRFLIDRVLPLVWSSRPEMRLALVGRGLELPADRDPRIEARGFVEDLPAEYARSAGAVVPLLSGGGTPFKLIEALAYRLPVIATSRAAAGLAVRPGEHYLPGDDAAAMAQGIEHVIDGGAAVSAMARRGRELVEQSYSIETLTALVAP
jgi:glycosyltransferase involved in cell wall biosynthesis